jgi:DNA-binding NarL/FixJ family response regulator
MGPIVVVLVEPVAVLRTALEAFLDTQADLAVQAVADVADPACRLMEGRVLLVSSEGPVEELRATFGRVGPLDGVPTILLTTDPEPELLRWGIEHTDAIVDKRDDPLELLRAVRQVSRSGTDGRRQHASVNDVSSSKAQLTSREIEVLRLLARNLTAAQVAKRLGVSVKTVNAHLQNAYRKLGVHSRMAALTEARRQGHVRSRSTDRP